MFSTRKVNSDYTWVGADRRRDAIFEGVFPIPHGVSYNSYLLLDEKTVLLDTVDASVKEVLLENIDSVLSGRELDYVVVHHMEPDHSASLMAVLDKYKNATVIASQKALAMIGQFFGREVKSIAVKEGDVISFGKHSLKFIAAPMVHWPEVMMSYDAEDKILFSADGFGSFGTLSGTLFSSEVDFERDVLDEARRYYTNIVGKYGPQVAAVLKKAAEAEIEMICPLHGHTLVGKDIQLCLEKYTLWSTYTPEKSGVVIAYGSIYGNTESVANAVAAELCERGQEVRVYDLSVTDNSYVISDVFKYDRLVICAPTYNSGVFVKAEQFISELVAHNIQKRKVAFVENGTWAATSGKQMAEMFLKSKDMEILDTKFTIKSSSNDKAALVEFVKNLL